MQEKQTSFKENVLQAIFTGAQKYKHAFLDYEYQVFSESFTESKFYIISATKSNFLHLTGVNTNLTATQFFEKAFAKTLTVDDFDFCKSGQSEQIVRGSVRRKVRFLPVLDELNAC